MKRQLSSQFAIAILVSLVFVVTIGLIELSNLQPPPERSEAPEPDTDTIVETANPSTPDCAQAELEFIARLDRSRSCTSDDECVVAEFGCPFGCTTSVRNNALTDLYAAEEDFQQACNYCNYLCSAPLFEWRTACVRQRCIVFDRTVEDLEEDTRQLINETS